MTHFHCNRCRCRVRIEHHARLVWCPSCGHLMTRGMGRRTRPLPPYAEPPETEPPAPAEIRAVEARTW